MSYASHRYTAANMLTRMTADLRRGMTADLKLGMTTDLKKVADGLSRRPWSFVRTGAVARARGSLDR